jgi:integrase
LNESEIVTLWNAGDRLFRNFCRFALLTAQRKERITSMRWDDVRNGIWYIQSDNERRKGTGGALKLPKLALEVLADMRALYPDGSNVFGNFKSHRSMLEDRQRRFETATGVKGWVIHDLRRTARSLMSAANVNPLHAELTLGHVQQGVKKVYDRHGYLDEKAAALDMLASKITTIVSPPPDNVVGIVDRRRRSA